MDYLTDYFIYKPHRVISCMINIQLAPKARHRGRQTKKGKIYSYNPSKNNEIILALSIKQQLIKLGNKKENYESFSNTCSLFAIIGLVNPNGDTDNYTKQLKDSLQNKNLALITNDKIIKPELVNIRHTTKDFVFFLLSDYHNNIIEEDEVEHFTRVTYENFYERGIDRKLQEYSITTR